MIPALAYLAAITAAETITVYVNPAWGVAVHTIIFLALIFHSALAGRDPIRQRFLLSLALAPLVRIISLAMPLAACRRYGGTRSSTSRCSPRRW